MMRAFAILFLLVLSVSQSYGALVVDETKPSINPEFMATDTGRCTVYSSTTNNLTYDDCVAQAEAATSSTYDFVTNQIQSNPLIIGFRLYIKGVYKASAGSWSYVETQTNPYCPDSSYPYLLDEDPYSLRCYQFDPHYDDTVKTICEDGYYSNEDGTSSDCSRPTPTQDEEIVICLSGATTPPVWPGCESGLDKEFVRGIDDSVTAAQASFDQIIADIVQADISTAEINSNSSNSLKNAALAAAASASASNDATVAETLSSGSPEINSLAVAASSAQSAADAAATAAASALAAATDAAVEKINAQQAYNDAVAANDTAAAAVAAAALARANLNSATSQEQADSLAADAAAAAQSAADAVTALTAALDSISNSLLASGTAASNAASAAADAVTAANQSGSFSDAASSASENGEVCIGEDCEVVPSDYESSIPNHSEAEYSTFSEANTAFYESINNAPINAALANFENKIKVSSGSCSPLSLDLSVTPINTTLSTSIHCEVFNDYSDIIKILSLIMWTFAAFRVFATA